MKLLRRAGGLALALALGWCVGLAWFVHAATRDQPLPSHTDGIVALTGGAGRVELALRLLAEGRADHLLLSGIGGGADLADFSGRAGLDAPRLADRVTIGRAATTTQGNADETAAWARAHGLRTLMVVTAGYHMPRALMEIGRAIPDATLYPVPVRPPAMRRGDSATVRLFAEEYTKWLASRLGLAWLAQPARPPTG